ncbi:tetratricopeptide repeat protein [Parasediminibacterium sp. JCM 36343]|uniref:tetratricopeptide repeat protein n=1 Tax=Parasediminibacterium sp. JCM 36343 TaxID=3374279 RepID=UPI00397DE992
MSDNEVEIPVLEADDVLLKAQGFIQKFGKKFAIGLGAGLLLGGGVFAYGAFVTKPKEEKAAEAIYKAQQYFELDSSKLVLDGDGASKGVLYIIKNYSGTKSANLATYYAGVSYLKLGNFAKAIEYLKDFKTDAKQIQMVAYGSLGDAYAESGKKDDAVDYYIKAANTFEKDESISAEYLFRAALLEKTLGKDDKALELFKELKEKFPRTEKGSQVDKYIYQISVEKPEL